MKYKLKQKHKEKYSTIIIWLSSAEKKSDLLPIEKNQLFMLFINYCENS